MDYRHLLIIMWGLTNIPTLQASQVLGAPIRTRKTLQCQVTTVESDVVDAFYWRKDGTTIYSKTSNGVKNTDDKYSVVDGTSLVIPNVVDSDKGNYSCKVVRRSLTTEESDITQLYVLDLSIIQCDGFQQGANGCSCYVTGANITSLSCSARGFPNPPDITWAWSEKDGEHTIRSSSLDLTRFHDNVTVVCNANERDVPNVAANTTVCVHNKPDISPTEGFQEETTSTVTTKSKTYVTAIILLSIIISLLVVLILVWLAYKRYTRKVCFCTDLTNHQWKSTPKTSSPSKQLQISAINGNGYDGGSMDVLKDSRKNSRANSISDNSGSKEEQPFIPCESVEDVDYSPKNYNEDISRANSISDNSGSTEEQPFFSCESDEDVDYSPKNYNEDIVFDAQESQTQKEQPIPLVAHVLLNDLRCSTTESKDSMKAVIFELLEKRVEPYKIHQQHDEANVTTGPFFIETQQSMQGSMMTITQDDDDHDDAAFVDLVCLELDKILDETDRDECEILITKPDFQEISDESEIPAFQGCRVINDMNKSLPLQHQHSDMSLSISSSTRAYSPLSTVIRGQMLKRTSERTAIRNNISQIILDSLRTGKRARNNHPVTSISYSADSGFQGANVSMYAQIEAADEVSQLVALWTSKTEKLDNDVNNSIRKYLFPLKRVKKSEDVESRC